MSQVINTTLSKAINSADGFHHLVYSISGTTHTLFLDNSAIAVNINGGNIFSTYPNIKNLFWGIAGDLSYGYTGYIDNFKVYNRALTTTDVSAIFNSVNTQIIASVVGTSIRPILSLSKTYAAFTNTTSTNTISFNQNVTANVFMIGGGGAGEGPHGGGGGAGAYYNGTFTFNANTIYTINVGAGGIYAGLNATGGNGGNTTITTGGVNQLIVNGGGGGVSTTTNGVNGGCGGGAGGVNPTAYSGGSAINTSTNGTGFAGGAKSAGITYAGGGGGGAGGVGQNGGVRSSNVFNGGNGGDAIVVNLKGFSEAYGGGGAGGSWDNNTGTQAAGGSVSINGSLVYVGGYGNISNSNGTILTAGTPPVANTGSGGGGGGAYSSYGVNGSAGIAIIQWTGASASDYIAPIDKLSSAAKTAMLYSGTGTKLSAGAYGITLLNAKYTGPSIQIKNGSSGTPTDFYPALDGTLTLKTSSGTTLTSFLAGEIAYVTKWYDQTGNGNHGTAQGSPLPFLNTTDFVVDFGTSGFFSLSDGSFPFDNTSYSYVYKQGRIPTTASTVWSGGNWGVFGGSGILLCTPTYNDTWYAYDFYGMNSITNSVVAATYGGAGNNIGVGGKKFYINYVLQTPTGIDGRTNPNGPRAQIAQNCFLGASHPSGRAAYFTYQSTTPYFYWLPYQLNTYDISILGST